MTRTALGPVFLLLAASPLAAAGIVFQTPFRVNSDADTDPRASDQFVRIAADGAGNMVAVWIAPKLPNPQSPSEEDIFFARSGDGGATWTPIAPLNNNAGSDFGSDREPALATDRAGHWLAVWSSGDRLNGTLPNGRNIFFARSSDNGATWTGPAPLNTDATTDTSDDIDERPAVAMDRNGHAIAAWQRYRSDQAIVVARSTDAGATWSNPLPLSPPDSRADWQASVAGDGAGHWVVAWRSDDFLHGPLGQDGDILVSISGDDGVTWSVPEPLNSGAATDDDFSDAEPEVLTDEAGIWLAIWNGSFYHVLVSRSTDNGATWSPSQSIWDGDSFNPRFATDRSGTWVAAWHVNVGTESTGEIYSATSFDNGLVWLPATKINTNPYDRAQDVLPDVASDGLGGWDVVWMSDDPYGGTSVDFDILIARGTPLLCVIPGVCPGSRCAMTAAKATGKYASDRLLCYARALSHGLTGDPACEQAAAIRYDATLAKAETFGDCAASMNLSQVSSTVDALYEDVSTALDATTACGAAKTMAAGKAAATELKCHAKAFRSGTQPSPACLAKAAARLSAAFAAAETRGGCTATGDAGSIADTVQSFVGTAVAALGSL